MSYKSNRTDKSSCKNLSDLSPSEMLVYKVLKEEGPLTLRRIIDETLLSPQTVHSALDNLNEYELIVSDSTILAAREKVYTTGSSISESELYI